MLGHDLGILPPDLWRMTFWEIGAIAAARIDASLEDVRPLSDLFHDLKAMAS